MTAMANSITESIARLDASVSQLYSHVGVPLQSAGNAPQRIHSPVASGMRIMQRNDDAYEFEGRLIVFDDPGPWDGLVFTGETQTALPAQNTVLAVTPNPVMFDHAMDNVVGPTIFGYIQAEGQEKRKDGLWIKGQIDRAIAYADELAEVIDSQMMGMSSSTSGILAQFSGNYALRWPVMESSITPIPANPNTLAMPAQSALLPPLLQRWYQRNAGVVQSPATTATDTVANSDGEGSTENDDLQRRSALSLSIEIARYRRGRHG